MTDHEFNPWLVMRRVESGKWQCIARYRFRGDAEAHAQRLNRMMPGYFMSTFEEPQVNIF